MHKAAVNEDVMTTREVGERLGVAVRTVQLWVEAGVLPAWRTAGGHRRISRQAVEQLLAQRHQGLLPQAVSAAKGQRPLKLFLVEDDQSLTDAFVNVVRDWPFPVELTTASNGFDGLIRIGETNPDVVVSDLMMPGMDGFQMLRNLCKPGSPFAKIKVLVASGLTQEEIEARGGLPDGVTFFQKPLRYARVEALLHKYYTEHILLRATAEA